MTFLEAAIEVLRHEKEPLHFSEIAKRAVERQLLSHVGRDPVAAMQVSLNAAIRGDSALIVRSKPGYYGVRPGAELPPPPAASPAPAAPAPVAPAPAAPAPVAPAPAVAPAVQATPPSPSRPPRERRQERSKESEILAPKSEAKSMLTHDPKDEESPAVEGGEDEDSGPEEGGGGRRKRRRRDRFGVRGEAPPPQLVAVKPTRRGSDTGRRAEVLQKVTPNLEFEAPKGAGLDGITDVALVMANAMSRLAEERPELRTELEALQRAPATPPPQPAIESRPQNGRKPGPQAPAAPAPRPAAEDGEERSGRRRRRRRRRGRRSEWSGPGEVRTASEEAADTLLQQVAQVLADAGSRSLHIRQIAEMLAGQGVLGGEISEIERAVTAAILLDIRNEGRASRFIARGDARYQLLTHRLPVPPPAAEQALHAAVRAVNEETVGQLVQWLQSLGPRGLEAVVRIWLEREGYPVVATLPPSRGIAKLVIGDPEAEDEDAKILVLVLPRRAGIDPAAWAGDLERVQAATCLVFAVGDVPADPPWGEARTLTAPDLAAWLRGQGIGVQPIQVEAAVLDPAVIESIGGLDT